MAIRLAGEPYVGTIQTRIRPGKDDDLSRELGDLPLGTDISDVTRTALRYWFGLVNQSQVAVARNQDERPQVTYEVIPAPEAEHVPPASMKPPEKAPAKSLELDTKDLILKAKEPSEDDLESNLDAALSKYF